MDPLENLLGIVNERVNANTVSVAQIAKDAGCSRQHIYQVLSGDSNPSFNVVDKLALSVGLRIAFKSVDRRKKSFRKVVNHR